jgi:DNA-directed RNA polymerase subunit RPC12/RpoP
MPSLLLHADDPLWQAAGPDSLASSLRDLGLIGSLTASEHVAEFQAGGQFLKLVMFLGCSPQVVLDPEFAEQGQAVCHIRLLSYSKVTLRAAKSKPAVRCAKCRAAVDVSSAGSFETRYRCQQCGNESRASDLDWRQSAGFGRCFIQVNGIYPHEAVPSDKLLNALHACSHCNWKYFYI